MISKRYLSYDDACTEKKSIRSLERMGSFSGEEQAYSLSPNPTNGLLHLAQALKDEAPVQVRIYNTVGALVYSGNNTFIANRSELQLPELASGLYHLVLQNTQGDMYRLPFVKQ